MQDLVSNLASEVNILEVELTSILQVDTDFSSESEVLESHIGQQISTLKGRLNSILISFSVLLTLGEEREELYPDDDSSLTNKELVITYVSTLLLNMFLRVILKHRSNLVVTTVILSTLLEDVEGSSSIQETLTKLRGELRKLGD
jgi:hypothetical protein